MDIALGLRIVNLIYKLINSKHNDLPDNFSNYASEFVEATKHEDLKLYKKHTLNNKVVDDFIAKLKQDDRINLAGIGIMHRGKLVREEYVYPYTSSYRHVSFSMSKSIVSMAVGIAINKNILTLDERLCDIFPEHDSVFFKRNMKDVTIKNLLTMTSGVCFDEVSAFFSEDWSLSYMGSDVMFEPGSEFSYNSLNTYMLVAIICKKSNCTLDTFLSENLFKTLGITDVTWDMCPRGTEIGGWGVKLSLIDMLKLGQLYIAHGKWTVNGKEISLIDDTWIKESIEKHVDLNDNEVILGYGYHIWLLKDGAYLFNGLFGQNVYINPDRELVIAIMASSYETFPDGCLVSKVCEFANGDKLYDNRFIASIENLLRKPKYELIKREQIKYDEETFFDVISEYLDNKYIFHDYGASILPICIQGFYSTFSTGIKSLSFKKRFKVFTMIVEENNTEYTINLGYQKGEYEYQIIQYEGKKMPVATYCNFAFDEDDRFLLKIRIIYLEEVGERVLKIFFHDDSITLKATEKPDLKEFVGMLFGESKIRKTKRLRKISTPEYLEYKIDKILYPISKGDVVIQE